MERPKESRVPLGWVAMLIAGSLELILIHHRSKNIPRDQRADRSSEEKINMNVDHVYWTRRVINIIFTEIVSISKDMRFQWHRKGIVGEEREYLSFAKLVKKEPQKILFLETVQPHLQRKGISRLWSEVKIGTGLSRFFYLKMGFHRRNVNWRDRFYKINFSTTTADSDDSLTL